MASGYEAYSTFICLKMHFSSEAYDYFKYNGKARVSEESFNRRRDRYYFEKLSRQKDLKNYIVSNMVQRNVTWVGDLVDDQADQVFTDWQKRIQSLSYCFSNDITNIEDLMAAVLVKKGQYPLLLVAYNRGIISIETLIILNDFLKFIPYWDKKINDTVIWPSIRMKCYKYKPFISYDRLKVKKLIKDHIDSTMSINSIEV